MKAAVFSGTSEGKEISTYLSCKKIETLVFTATEYGREVMNKMPYVKVRCGRLNEQEMCEVLKNYDFVIDATHPYAEEVTKNIKSACKRVNVEYIRLLREEIAVGGVVYVDNTEKAIEILKNMIGNIFISTGSKELQKFTVLNNYVKRLAVRVLPAEESKEKCVKLGIENVLYKKGPFSFDENIEDFKKFNSHILVTKSSGKTGGFLEKINAAKKLNMKIIVISRPAESDGMTMEKVKKEIDKKKSLKFPLFIDITDKKILVVGCGKIAQRRIETLKLFGAEIKVIADKTAEIDNVEMINKKFEESDICDDLFMVIAATNDREINHLIYKTCKDKNIFVSIADCKEECNFYFPAVCLSNNLSVGIVSDGNNHRLVREKAAEIRRILNEN